MSCQRWRERKAVYRQRGEQLRTCMKDYDIELINDDTTAKAFVQAHHYSASYPSAQVRIGLYRRTLIGVAVFSGDGARTDLLTGIFPGTPKRRLLELSRFVLLDEVPYLAESWFFARCRKLLRTAGYTGLIAHSDDFPRTTLRGDTFFAGHIGTIYQASNGQYLGRAEPNTVHVLPDGLVWSRAAQSKIGTKRQGWRYASQILVRYGAAPLAEAAGYEERQEWRRYWRGQLCRTYRHPGNHRYAWSLARTAQPAGSHQPYPKQLTSTCTGSVA